MIAATISQQKPLPLSDHTSHPAQLEGCGLVHNATARGRRLTSCVVSDGRGCEAEQSTSWLAVVSAALVHQFPYLSPQFLLVVDNLVEPAARGGVCLRGQHCQVLQHLE